MNGLLTDLYELTMAAGYFAAGKAPEMATFELSVRRLPARRNFVIAAGLEQAVEYLVNLQFTAGEIDYLRKLPQFVSAPPAFFDYLLGMRFTGDVFAVPEGTPVFSGEPVLTLRAPLIEAQIPETYLLSMIGFQSLVATKAARIVETAGGRSVVEFGTRRAHSPEAGVLAGRAAYIGGCIGTSNTLTGFRYGIPTYGTAAHSWVLAFAKEDEAFRQLQTLLGATTIYIVDTYDTLEGVRKAAGLGHPLWGVRLDSGDFVELSRAVRAILDGAGLRDAKIMASGDLDEYKIGQLVAAGAPIDAFGVGTELATSADAPNIGAVYKLVELESGGVKRYTAKFSEDKAGLPGAKQIFRFRDHDEVACAWEQRLGTAQNPVETLLRPVMVGGKLIEPLPGAEKARERTSLALKKLPENVRRLADPEPYRVQYSPELLSLLAQAWKNMAGAPA
jgi:nicotinate phosphoribosyltransferase